MSMLPFLICWLILCYLSYRKIRKLKSEIKSLNKIIRLDLTTHYLKGRNLSDFLYDDTYTKSESTIYVVTSADCAVCLDTFESFVSLYKNKFPFVQIDHNHNNMDNISFGDFKTININSSIINKMKINRFPTFLVVNKSGLIEETFLSLIPLNSKYLGSSWNSNIIRVPSTDS